MSMFWVSFSLWLVMAFYGFAVFSMIPMLFAVLALLASFPCYAIELVNRYNRRKNGIV